jgi:hypothetical protein
MTGCWPTIVACEDVTSLALGSLPDLSRFTGTMAQSELRSGRRFGVMSRARLGTPNSQFRTRRRVPAKGRLDCANSQGSYRARRTNGPAHAMVRVTVPKTDRRWQMDKGRSVGSTAMQARVYLERKGRSPSKDTRRRLN